MVDAVPKSGETTLEWVARLIDSLPEDELEPRVRRATLLAKAFYTADPDDPQNRYQPSKLSDFLARYKQAIDVKNPDFDALMQELKFENIDFHVNLLVLLKARKDRKDHEPFP